MSAIDELIKNAKTANEGLRPHYKWENNGTGINLAFNMTSQEVTNAAERDLAALRAERDEAVRLLKEIHSMNNIANLNDAELWNVNGEFEEKIAGIIRN